MTDITELAKAAEKYRSTLEAHRNNPRDGVALNAWDDATSKFMELVDNDELNIISGLLEALEKAQHRIEELESDLSEWTDCKHDGATYYDMSGQEHCGRCGADV
ncbi:hypothetical protein RAG08_10020 [Klebsiella variicola subsp. variicola]|uniref:hypothetical protein n=1 Tax=Klebsiella variicola TaxID=244366 RepID=UPI003003FD71